jgi:hypothetical protein
MFGSIPPTDGRLDLASQLLFDMLPSNLALQLFMAPISTPARLNVIPIEGSPAFQSTIWCGARLIRSP